MALTTRGGADQAQPPPAPDASLGFLTKRDTEVKLPRATRVKNKTPAGVQITAEQILREARERQEPEIRPPKQKITDVHELADYRLRERKRFEDLIRRVRWNVSAWVKYAKWEEGQRDFARARSVFERALDVAHRDHTLWLKYAEFEMRNRYVNHARNVWDRAVSLLPRIDQLWYKYIHMEELLGAIANARQVFERWMSWRPDTAGWNSYIKFELRYGEVERARAIYERFVAEHPRPDTFIRFAKFEMKRGEVERARQVYERAGDLLVDDEDAEVLFVAFAEFEEKTREVERARHPFNINMIELGHPLDEDKGEGNCSRGEDNEEAAPCDRPRHCQNILVMIKVEADASNRPVVSVSPALPVCGVDLTGDGKLGYGFTSADELEEVDIGPGDKPRPTFISKKLDPQLRGQMIALLKEYPDCFAWDYTEMPGWTGASLSIASP
ncbi:hypothetical protein QYE76_034296 [Lolium multiflorum]|uniref:Pre-mRNA-splicing factor Syf1-like N-terminal HAT-repeats domain-containing protein n=1 Tax=Lolium multiflorum TaxID=4521 RepID=A0AAD8VN62_LOLMU|nr:hypothetical protein QYE76_034296 [Lolium multiflorum]